MTSQNLSGHAIDFRGLPYEAYFIRVQSESAQKPDG